MKDDSVIKPSTANREAVESIVQSNKLCGGCVNWHHTGEYCVRTRVGAAIQDANICIKRDQILSLFPKVLSDETIYLLAHPSKRTVDKDYLDYWIKLSVGRRYKAISQATIKGE